MASDQDAVRSRLTAERNRLATIRDGLRDGLTGEPETASLEELSDYDQHPAETATETFNRERDLSTMESVEAGLDEVDRALQRLDDGTYGTCTACGRPIGAERLEALPATPFCIDDAQLASDQAAPGLAPRSRRDSGLEEPGRAI